MTAFICRFDMRQPGATPDERREGYTRALEQSEYAEAHGYDALMLSQHHGSEDGYLPSPLVMAAAVAARTTSVPISVAALLPNLYEPVKLAEDIAVLDHLSGGRVSYTFGLGYRPEEYEMFGRSWRTRGRDIEDVIRFLVDAWTGEPVEIDGRRVRVTPTPYSQPHPVLFYGGGTPAAARRAARLGLHFQPQVADRELKTLYREECAAQGREPGMVLMAPPGPANVFCSEDPDAFWGRHGRHLLADAQGYQRWRGTGNTSYITDGSTTVEEMRRAGVYVVLTPGELVARCRAGEIRAVTSHPMCGGLPADPSWESLRLTGEVVMPALRDQPATG